MILLLWLYNIVLLIIVKDELNGIYIGMFLMYFWIFEISVEDWVKFLMVNILFIFLCFDRINCNFLKMFLVIGRKKLFSRNEDMMKIFLCLWICILIMFILMKCFFNEYF